MKTMTFECDRCGNIDQDNSMDLWKVEIKINGSQQSSLSPVEWCRDCMLKTELLDNKNEAKEKEIEVEPITMEDLIREIVQDEMKNQ